MTETIAAIATPPGTGALGILRLSGARARPIAQAALNLEAGSLQPRQAKIAWAYSSGERLDQVVAVFFPGPHSATGEDLVEISAHGSPYILGRLLAGLQDHGARAAKPGEFTQRAFVNGRMDLAQAEAVAELIRADNQSAHRAALAQLEGGLSREIRAAREPILSLLVLLEARLDHPEEDLPALPAQEALRRLSEAVRPIAVLAESHRKGRLIAQGARIAIVGRPNAGKSSLLNALLGRDRAIVCATAGTTRDTLEEPCEVSGMPAVLIDTAGLREASQGEAEKIGMERARRALESSDLTLLVIDSARPSEPEDEEVHGRIARTAHALGRPLLTVANKADLPRRTAANAEFSVSAMRRSGIDELREGIAAALRGRGAESTLVLSARHAQALERARRALEEASSAVSGHPGRWEDRAASSLRQALRGLGEILGEDAPEEILRGIFERFCIGK